MTAATGQLRKYALSELIVATKKHWGPTVDALTAHHNRLKTSWTNKNTYAEPLPSTTTQFSIVDNKGVVHFPTPNAVFTKHTGTKPKEPGVLHPPQNLGPGYVGHDPSKGFHFTGFTPIEQANNLF